MFAPTVDINPAPTSPVTVSLVMSIVALVRFGCRLRLWVCCFLCLWLLGLLLRLHGMVYRKSFMLSTYIILFKEKYLLWASVDQSVGMAEDQDFKTIS